MPENCSTTVALQIDQRCLAHYSHCARLGVFLPWQGEALNFLGLVQQCSPSLGPWMTQALLPRVDSLVIPLVISLACCLRRETCSSCKAFQARTGISHSMTAVIVLAQPLLWMTSQPPPQVTHPFKFTSYCIVFPGLLLLILPAAWWSGP